MRSADGALIDSGPITATSKLEEVPEKHWYNLMVQRAMFVKARLPADCRCLVQFVADAELMYAPLGFKDADDFIAHGLELVPEEIRIAVDWLKINKPQEAIPHQVVLKLARHGVNQYSGLGNTNSISKGGMTCAYILARLERDGFAELAAKVKSGKITANAAAHEVKYRTPPISQSMCRELARQVAELENDNQLLRDLIEQLRTPENAAAIDVFYENFNAK
jgi:hypothetical protein